MKTDLQVLSVDDIPEIQRFTQSQANARIADEIERSLQSWSAPWREESLMHYLPLGWSFIARENQSCMGFFLAQPLLFFQKQTQVLWVEYLDGSSTRVREHLMDTAVRVAREKHLQRCLFSVECFAEGSGNLPINYKRSSQVNGDFWSVATTKSME